SSSTRPERRGRHRRSRRTPRTRRAPEDVPRRAAGKIRSANSGIPREEARHGGATRHGGRSMTVYASVIDTIGDTPIVDVSKLSPKPSVQILAKIESQNPAGSVKDRIARKMIEEAEADGTLTPGRTIIEPSSGNTGIALAMIARLKGYPIKIVLPENVSIERRQLLEIFGAEIILSP